MRSVSALCAVLMPRVYACTRADIPPESIYSPRALLPAQMLGAWAHKVCANPAGSTARARARYKRLA